MKTPCVLAASAAILVVSAGIVLAHPAVSAITDLNVRGGPGPQYPVLGVLNAGQTAALTGCIANSKWCSIDDGGQAGWVFSDYLEGQFHGHRLVLSQRPADSGVSVVHRPDEGAKGAIVSGATGSIGSSLVAGLPDATGEADEPPAKVRLYIASNRGEPVYLDGEVVVGARVPVSVLIHEVPNYEYRHVSVNGQQVLVEPGSRKIVYVLR